MNFFLFNLYCFAYPFTAGYYSYPESCCFCTGKNYLSQLDFGVDIPVWKGLSCNALYAFTHENVTVLDIKQNDRIITFGLAYYLRKN